MSNFDTFELTPSFTAFGLFAQDTHTCPPGEMRTVLRNEYNLNGGIRIVANRSNNPAIGKDETLFEHHPSWP